MRRFSCLETVFIISLLAVCFASAASAQTTYAITALGTFPGGSFSIGQGINASGQVTGYSYTTGNCVYHAFLYSGGAMTDLGTLPGGSFSLGSAINASGQVAGYSYTTGNSAIHAVLYNPGEGIVGLNTSLPSGSGWTLQYALAIDDSRQITGQGGNSNGDAHAFLLSPVLTITSLANLARSFNLPFGIANSLLAKLQPTKTAGPGEAGCNDLNDFIMEVEAQSGKILTAAQANQLVATANQITAAHSCP